MNYDLHRNLDGPTVFAIYEGSTERDALGTDFGTAYFNTLIVAADRLVTEHGPHAKLFTADPLAMINELSPTVA